MSIIVVVYFLVVYYLCYFLVVVEGGSPVGPGSITAGLSYVNDFTPVKLKSDGFDEKVDLLTRRNFNISLGYALKF